MIFHNGRHEPINFSVQNVSIGQSWGRSFLHILNITVTTAPQALRLGWTRSCKLALPPQRVRHFLKCTRILWIRFRFTVPNHCVFSVSKYHLNSYEHPFAHVQLNWLFIWPYIAVYNQYCFKNLMSSKQTVQSIDKTSIVTRIFC